MDRLVVFAVAVVAAPLVLVAPVPVTAVLVVLIATLLRTGSHRGLAMLCVLGAGLSVVRARATVNEHQAARAALASRMPGYMACEGTGRVDSSPVHAESGTAVTLLLDDLSCGGAVVLPVGATVRARVYTAEEDLARGDRVQVAGGFAPLERFFNLDDVRVDEARRGVTLSGSATWLATLETARGPPSWIDHARTRVRHGLIRSFGPSVSPLARALVLGEMDVGHDDQVAFQRSGLSHLLAVSGMHLVLVVLSLVAGLRALRVRIPALCVRGLAWRVAALVGLPLTWAYADFAGGSGSAQRAAWMLSVQLLAIACLRRPWAPRALGLSLLAGWAFSPLAAFDVSFALSALATGGMFVLGEPIAAALAARLGPRLHFFTRGVSASLAASIGCAPLIARMSGAMPLVSVVANIVAVPVGEMVALPLCLVAACLTPWPVLERGASVVAAGALLALDWIARVASAAPGASLTLPPPSHAELAIVAACVLVTVLGVGRRWRRRAWFLGVVALALAEASLRWPHPHELRITHLDVGQGDAALVELPDGESLLIDGGGLVGSPVDVGTRVLSPLLRAKRIRRLRAVILSHPHPDHYGGLLHGLDGIIVDELWDTGQGEREGQGGAYAELLSTLRARGTKVRGPDDLCGAHAFGEVAAQVLAPCPGPDAARGPNNNSFVVRLQYGRRAVLFVGDAEREEEAGLLAVGRAELRADVLKVGHHGSRTSSQPAWLAAVRPRVAVISSGARNRFGHPHASTLQALRDVGARVLSTKEHGAVTIVTNGESLRVTSADGEESVVEDVADERQVPVTLGHIQPVPDHELVLDREAQIVDLHADAGSRGLVQERADLDGARVARLEEIHQVRDRQPRVDDVLDDEDVLAGDGLGEVVRDLDDAGALRAFAVGAHAQEVHPERQIDRAAEIRRKDEAALEDDDEDKVAIFVVPRYLRAELQDSVGDLDGADHGVYTLGHRSSIAALWRGVKAHRSW